MKGAITMENNKHVQRNMILDHMRNIGPITRAEAMDIYGIGNITARLTELRQEGYKIQTIMTQSVNRYGRHITYARWMLMEA